jgi:hypothetical protein
MESTEKLMDYPAIADPFMEFEASNHFNKWVGRSCLYGVSEEELNGHRIVYLNGQRETDKAVDTPAGLARMCERYVVVCGEPVRNWRTWFITKIKPIPQESQEETKLRLLRRLADRNESIGKVFFWREDGR